MPDAAEILEGLTAVANAWQGLAVLWHLYFALLLAALLSGKLTAARTFGLSMVPPLASVSLLAWWAGNPFNGSVFAPAAALFAALSLRAGRQRVAVDEWMLLPGLALIGFGWVYPHFLAGPGWTYLIAAPAGLIPCPTLSVLTGLALVTGGHGLKAASGLLAGLGLFYGLYGALVLGVTLDWALAAGAAWLAWSVLRPPRPADPR